MGHSKRIKKSLHPSLVVLTNEFIGAISKDDIKRICQTEVPPSVNDDLMNRPVDSYLQLTSYTLGHPKDHVYLGVRMKGKNLVTHPPSN